MLFSLLKVIPKNTLFRLHADGSSMYPIIQAKEEIIVKKCSYEEVNPFEIIAFYNKKDKAIIVHRLIKKYVNSKSELKLISKGDNNSSNDTQLIKNEIFLGKVVSVNKNSGRVIDLRNNNISWLRYGSNNHFSNNLKKVFLDFLYF